MVEFVVPILQDLVDVSIKAVDGIGGLIGLGQQQTLELVAKEIAPAMQGQVFVRIAGISGAASVALGAYGAHKFKPDTTDAALRHTWDTANKYHMFHSLALLAVPLTRRPYIVGTLMLTGMSIFSGTCYYHCLTGKSNLRKITPYGGMLLIAAWIAIAI